MSSGSVNYKVHISHRSRHQAGVTIETDGSVPLLDTLEKAGVHTEFGCRQGFCGACRVQLAEGEVTYLTPPLALLRKGEVLACCCRAQSDILLVSDI